LSGWCCGNCDTRSLAIAVTVGLLLPVPDAAQSEYSAAVLSVLG
jgi:hypothetical protein